MLTAQVETLAKEAYDGKVNFYGVNAAADRALLNTLNIRGVPSFLFYKNGRLYDTLSGNHLKKDQVREKTDEMLAS
ncbi:MAG: thioredoxin family protein [Deltaproteobacteria bacterium]|nr:thioredoxin family protein [Deltaproteobacteria bacterium]